MLSGLDQLSLHKQTTSDLLVVQSNLFDIKHGRYLGSMPIRIYEYIQLCASIPHYEYIQLCASIPHYISIYTIYSLQQNPLRIEHFSEPPLVKVVQSNINAEINAERSHLTPTFPLHQAWARI